MSRTWVTAIVEAATDAAKDIRSVRLAYPWPVKAAPGSHIEVMVPIGGHVETRHYSVVAHDPAAGTIELGIRLAADGGGGSRYMHGLVAGDRLRVTPPLQNFPLTPGRPGYVLVAGGIGITPLLSMFQTLHAEGADARLVYAGRDRAAMAFLDELDGYPGRVEFVVEADGAAIEAAELVASVPEDYELYVCGPIGLLEALRTAWQATGRHPSRFRFETFGNSGRHPAEEFVVEVPRLAISTIVPTNRSLLQALEAAGAEMMFDCQRGECGLCEVKVLSCQGIIDHRDVFLSHAQHAAGDYVCTCVSRVASAKEGATPPKLILELP